MKKLLSTCILLFVIAIFSLTAQTRVYAPTLIEPENGEVDQMPNVILNWTPVTGVHGEVLYDVELDTDAGFGSPITFNTNLSAVNTTELTFNAVYYWRVKAIDGPDISDWSDTWSFQVVNMLDLKKPNDNEVEIPPSQILTWDTISGVTHYDIQLDTSYFWKFMDDSTDVTLNDIYFTSGSEGWIVGDEGTLLYVDAANVTTITGPTTENLYGVALAAADDGIAVGAGGTILYYNGTDWTMEANSPATDDLNDVAVVSATDAWAVGTAGSVFRYDGTNWTAVNIATTEDLTAVDFVDANNGWVVGTGGTIFYFNGTEFAEQSEGSKDFYGVSFLNATTGYVCGESGKIWKYDGTEWEEMDVPSGTKDLFSIFFTGPAMGYAIGEEGNFLQYGGASWYKQTIGSEVQFNSIFFADGVGYTAGEEGQALYNDGEGFSSMNNVHSRNADSGAYLTKFMYFGKKYYWRVRARHSQDTSAWSATRNLNIVPNVILVSPENDETEIGLSDEFTWEEIDGVLTYEAQFADNENFSNPYIEFTEDHTLIRNNLFFGRDYYWRVRANHATDTSAWSESWHFNTINTVNLSSPANNATDVEILPTLVWEPISGVDKYQIVYDSLEVSNPCCDVMVNAPDHEYNVVTAMVNGTSYKWHVRAINGIDTTEWSALWTFTIEPVQGLNEMLDETKVKVYPNPSSGNVYLEYEAKEATTMKVYIMDLVGQVMQQQELFFNKGKSTQAIDLGNLPNGIYLVRYSSGDRSFTRKITLNK